METPDISVVIPTLNSEAHIQRAIKSILDQTHRNFEILIMDGMSTDSTLEKVQYFNDSRVRILSAKDNGVYDAMNNGIRLSRGNWLYFLGSDDMLFNDNVFSKVCKHATKANADLLYGNVCLVGNSYWAKDGAIYDGEFAMSKLFQRNICHQAIFYSRYVFKEIGYFNTAYQICSDWDFNHRCFAYCRVTYIEETIAYFAAGGKSSKTVTDQFTLRDSIFNLKKYYGLGYTNPMFKPLANTFLRNARSELTKKRFLHSLYFFFISLIHTPHKISFAQSYFKTFFGFFRKMTFSK